MDAKHVWQAPEVLCQLLLAAFRRDQKPCLWGLRALSGPFQPPFLNMTQTVPVNRSHRVIDAQANYAMMNRWMKLQDEAELRCMAGYFSRLVNEKR
jgi:hypothetical protein